MIYNDTILAPRTDTGEEILTPAKHYGDFAVVPNNTYGDVENCFAIVNIKTTHAIAAFTDEAVAHNFAQRIMECYPELDIICRKPITESLTEHEEAILKETLRLRKHVTYVQPTP